MDTFLNRPFDFASVFKSNDISRDVQDHLAQVYRTLTLGLAAAAGAAYVNTFILNNILPSMLTFIGSILLILYMSSKRPVPLKAFLTFCALTGAGMSPLLEYVSFLDPMIIVKALAGTVCIFGSFSLAALFAKRRSLLYLTGALGTVLTIMSLASLMNYWARSSIIFDMQLYGGLLMFLGYVVVDTQMIIERASAQSSNDRDPVGDSVQLFIDFMGILVRIVIILAKNKEKENNKKKERK